MPKLATFYDHIRDVVSQESISVPEALQETKAMGVQLLEIAYSNILGRVDEVAKELSLSGLGISAVPAFFDFCRNSDVDGQSTPILEAARELGAKKMLVIPGFYAEGDSAEERRAGKEQIVECLLRLAEKAGRYGISLTMEEFDNALSPIASAEGVRYCLDRCPGLSSTFDTGNFRFSAQDEHKAYDLLRDRIDHVHLKDRAYAPTYGQWALTAADGKQLYPCPVGAGDLDISGILRRLKDDGYDGIYTVEHYGAPAMLDFLRQSVRWVKEQLALP